jgi:hypothetical protein
MAFFVFGRRLVGGCSEARIPFTAAAAFGGNATLSVFGEVEHLLAGLRVVNHGSYRYRNFHIAAIASGLLAAFAVPAALGRVLRVEPQMEKRAVVLACYQRNFAAATAVTTAGSAARDKFLTPERQATVAAVSGFNGNRYFVYEHWKN